jgi:cysteinyl-tRNA synthetase
MDRARATLRAMIVRLADAARAGLRDPRQVLGPIVEAALVLRARVRAEGRYDLSDLLRDELAEAGVEVRDTPEGIEWMLRAGS